jgi:DNA (cytosine-5)-methyltransferase 1
MKYTTGSLFSGIGGIDKAFEAAGFPVQWQCESDGNARHILRRHWPDLRCYEDIRELDGATILPVDILLAGFPCQDLSIAGGRSGMEGNRSSLFFEITRLVQEMRDATDHGSPTFLVLENVPGLYTTHRGRDFAVVLRTLAECGALDIAWRVLDAQYFGVPQRRRRVFIVADFRDERAQTVLFEPEGRGGYFATRAKKAKGIAAPLTSGSHGNGVSRPGRHMEDDVNLVARPILSHHRRLDQESEDFVVAHTLRAEGCDASEDGTGRGVPLVPVCPGGKTDASYWKETEVANTVAAGDFPWQGTRIKHADQTVRRLTPRECERLQGFPDDWTETVSDTARYTLIGNSVAVPVLTWIAQRMHNALDQD